MTPRFRAAALTAACFSTLFMAPGAHLPFWPVWLADRGLSPGEIGSIAALAGPVRIVAGFALPALAERLDRRAPALALLLGVTGGLFAVFGFASGYPALLALSLLVSFAWAGAFPLAEALGNSAARRAGFAYARPRGIGSFFFLTATLASGALVETWGPEAIRWWIVASLLLAVPVALSHPGGPVERDGSAGTFSFADLRRMAGSRVMVLLALATALAQGSHCILYAFATLHWTALGLSGTMIGALWSAGVAVEVALMVFLGPALIARLGATGAIALSAAAATLRWALMGFDPDGPLLWLLQCGHAVTFGLGHLGMMAFLARAVPDRLGATAQGFVVQLAGGTFMAAGTAAGSALYETAGGATYGVAAAMAGAGLLAAGLLARAWDGRALQL